MTNLTENNSNIIDGETCSASEPEENAQLPKFSRWDIVMALLCAVFAFCFVKFVLFHTTGFITTALYICIITASVFYLRHKGFRFSGLNTVLTAALYIFSFVFSITDNGFIKALDVCFLFGAGSYLVYSAAAEKTDVERFLPFALAKAMFEYPFSRFGVQTRVAKAAIGDRRSASNLKMILLGLIIAIVPTIIVGLLLMSADEGLERMLGGFVVSVFSNDMRVVFAQVLVAIPCSMYLFSVLYTNTSRDGLAVLDEDECGRKLEYMRSIPNMVLYTAVTPICILYVLFFISQASYFLSAFGGSLPEGFSHAEYARRGFFELFAVSLINLAIIIIMSLFAKQGGSKKPLAMKLYSTVLSVFTLILIATAVSKMVMYIQRYGLTQLRVYTTWFMLLTAVIFVFVIVKLFRFDFHIARWTAVTFTIMFGLLCFSRPDALIARYNIGMYQAGYLSELDTSELKGMSDDSLLIAVRSGAVDKQTAAKKRSDEYESDPYSRYNISSLLLSNELKGAEVSDANGRD